jgi:hypothetical protein
MLRTTARPCCRALSIGHWALSATLAITGVACGKKGPPLAPIIHIPAAVEKVDARRRGNDVSVTVTVPAKNVDGSVPVDVARIEIYGYTGTTAPPASRFLEVATLVGTITVPEPKPDAPPDAAPPPGTPVPGGTATIVESLTPDALVAKPIPPDPTAKPALRPRPAAPTLPVAAAPTGPLRRFYYALPFSPRGRPGPPGMIAELRLTTLPEAPRNVKAIYLADLVRLEWEPSGGLIGFLLERSLSPELSPLDNPLPEPDSASDTLSALQGPTRYNVYREVAPPETSTAQPAAVNPPDAGPQEPINPTPLDTLNFVDPLTGLDGRRRCYVVRALRGDGTQTVEGTPSDPDCVVPIDDFPPEAPARLSTTIRDGEIELRWEPNAEPDIAGYLVLRGEPGDATLAPVTDTVVTEARFVDRTVRPGVRYVYAVQAIDSRLPRPNVSVPSARVEETAR